MSIWIVKDRATKAELPECLRRRINEATTCAPGTRSPRRVLLLLLVASPGQAPTPSKPPHLEHPASPRTTHLIAARGDRSWSPSAQGQGGEVKGGDMFVNCGQTKTPRKSSADLSATTPNAVGEPASGEDHPCREAIMENHKRWRRSIPKRSHVRCEIEPHLIKIAKVRTSRLNNETRGPTVGPRESVGTKPTGFIQQHAHTLNETSI